MIQHGPVELFTSFGENDSVMNMKFFVSSSRLSGEERIALARKGFFLSCLCKYANCDCFFLFFM